VIARVEHGEGNCSSKKQSPCGSRFDPVNHPKGIQCDRESEQLWRLKRRRMIRDSHYLTKRRRIEWRNYSVCLKEDYFEGLEIFYGKL
jgi:hypothetical protein